MLEINKKLLIKIVVFILTVFIFAEFLIFRLILLL